MIGATAGTYAAGPGGYLFVTFGSQPNELAEQIYFSTSRDGGDFLSWQRGCRLTGAHHFEGDADGDQCVGASDLAIWRQDFGSATVATVPEPTAIVLMSMAAVCVGTLRRR